MGFSQFESATAGEKACLMLFMKEKDMLACPGVKPALPDRIKRSAS